MKRSEKVKKDRQIMKTVYDAKTDVKKADELIRSYIPFIRSECSKFMGKICNESDDEFSVAMSAFYEAIMNYEKEKGAFISYAALVIKSRLIDYSRKESRHKGEISIYEETEDEQPLIDKLPEENDYFEYSENRSATKEEIIELSEVMKSFGITFSDVADNCPKQERTMEVCRKVIKYASDDKDLLDRLLKTKKLPMAELVKGSGAERKTLERHRKYILAMLLIQTNGYEIIRGHLRRILNRKGESTR